MIIKNDVSQVRKNISRFVGNKVRLESNKGRQKTIIKNGTIESVYPSIFTIMLDGEGEENEKRLISYSYTDVLTKTVEITVFD